MASLSLVFSLLLCWPSASLVNGNPFESEQEQHKYVEKKFAKFHGAKSANVRRIDKNPGDFPTNLLLEIESSAGNVPLFLKRNKMFSLDKVKITYADDNMGKAQKENIRKKMDVSYYTDPTNGAVITAKKKNNRISYEGTLITENSSLELTPSDSGYQIVSVNQNVTYETDTDVEDEVDQINVDPVIFSDFDTIADVPDVPAKIISRKKRTVNNLQESFHVEVMFVIDYSTYSYWVNRTGSDEETGIADMLVYFGYIFNGMQMAFSSINVRYPDLKILPWLNEIYICNTPEKSWFTTNEALKNPKVENPQHPEDYAVYGNTVFRDVNIWRYQNGYNWSNPDHLMVWTKYDIKNSNVVGIAPVGTICKGIGSKGGTSLVEEVGPFGWHVAAHELGHSLGSKHDGQKNACLSSNKYIMASGVAPLKEETYQNSFTFSNCSIDRMRDTLLGLLDNYPRACVYNTACEHGEPVPDDDSLLPGQIYSLDEQCQIMLSQHENVEFGTQSWCSYPDVCKKLKCRSENTCFGLGWAADGTPCGNVTSEWCIAGECVPKTVNREITGDRSCDLFTHDVPPISECADTENVTLYVNDRGTLRYMSCAQILEERPEFCFRYPSVASGCDRSCIQAGLAYDGASCNAGCHDVEGVTFAGGVTCSEAASVYHWCPDDAQVRLYCCASCNAATV